ncbi:hypothetical protein HDU91_004301 [Kappamyces sp. JEL0680]|nr:hypothetical protein HDU91_004301 [Kappamyces sp. JEL0680]
MQPSPYRQEKQGPAPLPADYRPVAKQSYHVDEVIEMVPAASVPHNHGYHQAPVAPVVPMLPVQVAHVQPAPIPYAAAASPPYSPYGSGAASPLVDASAVSFNGPSSPMSQRPEQPSYGGNRDMFGSPLAGNRRDSNQDSRLERNPSQRRLESESGRYRDLPPAGGPGLSAHRPVMNQKVGPIVSRSEQPPTDPGFFGFWDKSGHFHQGFTDDQLQIHGGVFDDQCYFYFGEFGTEEPVLVEDSMMAYRTEEACDTLSTHSYGNENQPEFQNSPDARYPQQYLQRTNTMDSRNVHGGSTKPRMPPMGEDPSNPPQVSRLPSTNMLTAPIEYRGDSMDVTGANETKFSYDYK